MAKPKAGAIPGVGDIQAIWEASGLKSKLLFTITMLAVFRLGVQVPVWGVHAERLQGALGSQMLGFLDMFSGGALTSVSVLALGIGPYITSSIIMQLLTVVIPRLEELQKEEGEAGRRKISQYTRYLTVVLAMFQAGLILRLIGSAGAIDPGITPWVFYVQAILALTAGSVFALWVSEIITERGIGNGGSLLIFSGILSRVPFYWTQTEQLVSNDAQKAFFLVILLAIYLVTIGLIIVLQEATRKIFIVSAKRQVGNRIYGGQNTHIPFKINPAGVMPIIFAFAVLAFPSTIFAFLQQQNPTGLMRNVLDFYTMYLAAGKPAYIVLEFLLIVFFTFFYSSIIPSMQPKEIADNLKKYGSSIPGVKPGRPTSEKLGEILSRTTFIGAFALAAITLIASSATSITGITTLQGLGATSLIIMVGVALDTVNQIRVHLLARQYEGFLK
ncbi:preprotein translocase subunit SecY [Vampirovibrio chlorellavorus]|uniref:preprotein translocase subunit SecY n=1 Tax=Vampirovibrio chlorellavorus TaxID=758823 RepID=UPI0026F208DD|nr:preprotein translocase subunit SecY [Vampirovibrio chlorellavorus]